MKRLLSTAVVVGIVLTSLIPIFDLVSMIGVAQAACTIVKFTGSPYAGAFDIEVPGPDYDAGAGCQIVHGNDQANVIRGQGGADEVYGYGGADTLRGNAGQDKLDGGEGNDNLNGGEGTDTITGGPGNDQVQGSPGNDIVYG